MKNCSILLKLIRELSTGYFVLNYVLDFLLNKKLISKHQHGFMRHHSTTTNLLECTHDWIVGLSNGNNIDVICIDFTKAFDSIVFSKLLYKLKQCGKLLLWLSSFIHGRSQRVVVQSCFFYLFLRLLVVCLKVYTFILYMLLYYILYYTNTFSNTYE